MRLVEKWPHAVDIRPGLWRASDEDPARRDAIHDGGRQIPR
jgi:hypothetical protein